MATRKGKTNDTTTSSPEIVNSQDVLIRTPAQTAQSASGSPKDEARKVIAKRYITSFLLIVSGTLAFMLWRCYTIADIKDILLAESGILSGPLGFIIGFYFKEELEKNK